MTPLHCPVCGKQFDAVTSTALPFCSARCRVIDLGRWLDERNHVPHLPTLEELEDLAEDPPPEGISSDESSDEQQSE